MSVAREMVDFDEEWPRCHQCHQPEPCECVGLCDMCGLLYTRGEETPCHYVHCTLCLWDKPTRKFVEQPRPADAAPCPCLRCEKSQS